MLALRITFGQNPDSAVQCVYVVAWSACCFLIFHPLSVLCAGAIIVENVRLPSGAMGTLMGIAKKIITDIFG